MLQIGTEAEAFQTGPDCNPLLATLKAKNDLDALVTLTEPLVHSIGMFSPFGELVAKGRELLGVWLDVSRILVKENLEDN